MEFSRQEYWSRLSLPSPRDLPDAGNKPRSPTFQSEAWVLRLSVNFSSSPRGHGDRRCSRGLLIFKMKLFSRSRGMLSAQESNFHPQNNIHMQGSGAWAHGNCRWSRDFPAHLPLRSLHSKGALIGLLILPKVPGKASAAPTQN